MLPAAARMRRSAEFTATMRSARSVGSGGLLVLHAAPGDPAGSSDPIAHIGFVIPRAVGPAVVRNRVRRRLRHLLRDRLTVLPPGSRWVVRVLPAAASAAPASLAEALDRGLDRASARMSAAPVGSPR